MGSRKTLEIENQQEIAEKLGNIESNLRNLISLVPEEKRGQAFLSLANLVLITDGLYQLDPTNSGPKIMKAAMKVTEELAKKS